MHVGFAHKGFPKKIFPLPTFVTFDIKITYQNRDFGFVYITNLSIQKTTNRLRLLWWQHKY